MGKINDLQDKIQVLQSQITQKQVEILDYTTNKTYQKTYTYQENCGHLGCMELGSSCMPYKTTTYNTKQTELTRAQNTLKSLQNQLTTTQAELDSLIKMQKEQQAKQEQEKERQEALKKAELARLISQCSNPPQAQI